MSTQIGSRVFSDCFELNFVGRSYESLQRKHPRLQNNNKNNNKNNNNNNSNLQQQQQLKQ